jgi:hypothetical protein
MKNEKTERVEVRTPSVGRDYLQQQPQDIHDIHNSRHGDDSGTLRLIQNIAYMASLQTGQHNAVGISALLR